ncbi:hypothetical protein CYMTET_51564 [Cymbomonas tetramitiformis]|uniref:Apple domain-containing protein n=1 Tax=Cymbomonas tetramitiformis TaxID=36881 RepID=A0AAE0BMA0_9CHLO|nr:hypothetical protein CYMTET_51564 [Cymbomonas tetramitiformis]
MLELLRARVRWNLCMRNGTRAMAALPDLCWFDNDQRVLLLYERSVMRLDLKLGEWYIRVLNDPLHAVRGQILEASNTDQYTSITTTPSWDPCPKQSSINPPVPVSPGSPPAPGTLPLAAPTTPVWSIVHQRPDHDEPLENVEYMQGDRNMCQNKCHTTTGCIAFAYHTNSSKCFFKACFDFDSFNFTQPATLNFEFHYFQQATCLYQNVGDCVWAAANATSITAAVQKRKDAQITTGGVYNLSSVAPPSQPSPRPVTTSPTATPMMGSTLPLPLSHLLPFPPLEHVPWPSTDGIWRPADSSVQ